MSTKTGRNDPCPCGSGKKYKHCCLERGGNVINFPSSHFSDENLRKYSEAMENWDFEADGTPPTFNEFMGNTNQATSAFHGLQQSMQGQEFNSLQEMQQHMNARVEAENSRAIDDFLGLSPSHIRAIMQNDITRIPHIVEINQQIDPLLAAATPVYTQCLFLLQTIANNEKGIKATKTGNLPVKLTREFYDRLIRDTHPYPHTPSTEFDVSELSRAKFFLRDSGLIKYQKNHYSVTKKGLSVLNKPEPDQMYVSMFNYFISEFNWRYGTRFPENFNLVQQTAAFCLYITHQKAHDFISDRVLGSIYLAAFPALANVYIDRSLGESMVMNCYRLTFLSRTAHYLGLLDRKPVENKLYIESEYKTNRLFSQLLKWKL